MNDATQNGKTSSGGSFFSFAAWYSLITPFAMAVIAVTCVAIYAKTQLDCLRFVYPCAFWVFVSSFALGVSSLFGIRRHGASFILMKAVIGILASGFFGYMALILWAITTSGLG
jgi:hypothetical protein